MAKVNLKKEQYAAVILAAGKGTRMGKKDGSDIPKVMFPLAGKPIIYHSVELTKKAGIKKIVLVVGYKKEMIEEYFGDSIEYAVQDKQLGTGHAAACAKSILKNKAESIIVFYGDNPLYKPETIKKIIKLYEKEKPTIAMLSVNFDDPVYWVFGRIIRDKKGYVKEIIEQKDCNKEQIQIKECNPGFYIFNANWFWKNCGKLKTNNAQGEYYLTDMIKIAVDQGKKVVAMPVSEESEALGINTLEQKEQAEKILLLRKKASHKISSKKINTLGIIKDAEKILLAMKKRGFGAGWWNGYGGKLKDGETIEEALIREFKEESNVDVLKHEKKGVLTFEFLGNPEAIEVHVYNILDYQGEPQESEEMKPEWFSHNKIPFDSMWPDDPFWLPYFLADKNFYGRFLFGDNNEILEQEITETNAF